MLRGILRFIVPFSAAWLVVGGAVGTGLGLWTGVRNGFHSFLDVLLLGGLLAVTFGGMFLGAGLVVGVLVGAWRTWRARPARYRPGELGLGTAVATLGFVWAARWFEFEGAYPHLWPFVDGMAGMTAIAGGVLLALGAFAAGTAAGCAAAAARLRRRGVVVRFPWSAGAVVAILVAGSGVLALRPAPPPAVASDPPAAAMPDGDASRPLTKVLLVGCDGAEWQVIDRMIERGELPALRDLIERGIRASLETIPNHPSPALWTSLATSKSPLAHGIADFWVQGILGTSTPVGLFPRHFGLNSGLLLNDVWGDRIVRVSPVNAGMIRARRVWDILADNDVPVGVVHWLVSWPAAPGPAFAVSDRTFAAAVRSREEGLPLTRDGEGEDAPLWVPAEIDEIVASAAAAPRALEHEDEFVGALALALHDRYRPQVLVTYFRDVDAAEHLHWDRLEPEYFGREADGDRWESPIPEAYRRFDRVLEDLVTLVGRDAVVIVVSDHGHGPWFTWFGRGTPGGHTNAPPGVFLAAGPGIVRGKLEQPVSLYDVTPTLLRLVGLPPAEDMEGRVLREILDERALLPLELVATYETGEGSDGLLRAGRTDEELFENLRSLGYIR